MKRRLFAAILVVAAQFSLAGSATAENDDLPVPADKSAIVMNFENVELTAFVKFISKITGRNIVFGDKVEGTVSVVSPTPVNVEQAFAMFQSVLATQGLTTVDEGAVLRVVATKDARTSGAAVDQGGQKGGAGFATRLISLRYVNAGDIARVLVPQVSKDGSIIPYEGTNTVIVSDTASNLSRISEMVRVMDIPGHEQGIAVIPLKHAEAVRTAEQIVDLLLGPSSGGGGRKRSGSSANDEKEKGGSASPLQLGFKITPDERTNSLVVMAPAVEMGRIRELTKGLDTELRPGEEKVHVYYAKNADAENLVEVVSAMILGSKAKSRRGDRESKNKDQSNTMNLQQSSASTSSLSNPSAPPSASNENVSITADPATNAVIVEGAAQEWKTIVSLLEKLDIPRPQVFIEAIIVEASANRSKALGLDYQTAVKVGAGTMLLRSNIAQLSSAFTNPLALGGLVAAAASDKTVTLADGTSLPANYALLQALDSTSDVNVLSAPTLLTLDNQEAEMLVGENVPFVTGRAASLTTIQNVFTTVERHDVGIKLKVRPQVAEGDIVVLEVQQEVSALVTDSTSGSQASVVGPTTTIRSASTTVSVGDGRTVVIGGLISNRAEQGESKVPILGDIPWLGRLFRYERKDKEKVNLIIFLTPHVIRTPGDLDFVSKDRRGRFRDENNHSDQRLPGDPPPPPDPLAAADAVSEANAAVVGATAHNADRAAAPAAAKKATVATKTTTVTKKTLTAPPASVVPASAPAPAAAATGAAASDAPRDESSYRHTASDKAARVYPLDKDTRERAPF